VHVDTGATLVAKEKDQHFNRAIDLVVDKMERQLKKDNEKHKHHKGIEGVRRTPPPTVPTEPERGLGGVPRDG
jgi:ribosome-associated translation inhibitor RaiA